MITFSDYVERREIAAKLFLVGSDNVIDELTQFTFLILDMRESSDDAYENEMNLISLEDDETLD